jgi:hypothetical protein
MVTSASQSRAIYLPSGKVDWLKFLPGLFVAAGAALAMAGCLYIALVKGLYLFFIAPLFATLVVMGVWYGILRWSHCRSKFVATAASLALALLLYGGYYYIGLLQLVGVQNANRIDLLPLYVQQRMKTDVPQHFPDPKPQGAVQRKPDAGEQVFNWCFAGGELIFVIGVLVAVGRYGASRAYCESCRRWMKGETLKLPAGIGPTLWNSLQAADYADVQRRLSNTSRQSGIGCSLTVEYCAACPAEEGSQAVYLTVKDLPAPGTRDPIGAKVASLFRPRPIASLRAVVSQAELQPKEIGVLAGAFPGLKSSIAAHPILLAEAQSAAHETRLAQGSPDGWKRDVARVEAVEPGDAGKVLTRRNAMIQTAVGVASVFGLIGLAFLPMVALQTFEAKPADEATGIVVVWMFACFALNLCWVLFFPTYLTARYMQRQTRLAFESRLNPAIDLHDADLFFVDIIPRINWGKAMMENASDIGFLKLDAARHALTFEGDRERYRIPVESILEIRREFWAESVKHQLQKSPTLRHVVVVRAMTADGPWETWFYRRHNAFRPQTAKRRLADAAELESKIRAITATVS